MGRQTGSHVSVFKNFGTAMLRCGAWEVEFVGARKESYRADSRKPIVEDGTIEDDQLRRDFTINAMAFSLNDATFGELVDPFGGMDDLDSAADPHPLRPGHDVFGRSVAHDPRRQVRHPARIRHLSRNVRRHRTQPRADRNRLEGKDSHRAEQNHALARSVRSGFDLFDRCGLLELIFPELSRLKGVERVGNRAHKDNFRHTLKVLDNIALRTDDLWLRWAALLHDIGKPRTRAYDPKIGWTFHGHEVVGSKMIPGIFRTMKLPMNEKMKYVQKLVFLHLRPIILSEEIVTDSAVRRLLFEAGDDIDDLMTLCEADITSANDAKVKRYLQNFELVRVKLREIEEKDRVRNFQPPVTGEEIMRVYGLEPCRIIGEIKSAIKDAILDGVIANDHGEAFAFMERLAAERGLTKKEE